VAHVVAHARRGCRVVFVKYIPALVCAVNSFILMCRATLDTTNIDWYSDQAIANDVYSLYNIYLKLAHGAVELGTSLNTAG
jgi:hypothetical protein